MIRTSNPTLNDKVFTEARTGGYGEMMTIPGTVNKTLILLFIASVTASWAWFNATQVAGIIFVPLIIGFVIAIVTVFKRDWAPVTAPLYALCEGFVLGAISYFFEARYSGIVVHAIMLTFSTLFCLLMAYKSGMIRASENFKLGIFAATGAICLIYVVDLIMGLFGHRIPMISDSGPMGIVFSLIVVVIAALNLVLDFDFIEKGSEAGLAKHMEWYGAFGLMVTLIWLYFESLRLLSKLRSRD